jgi:hypothetical protein
VTVLNAADAVYIGPQKADAVYAGSELVWSSAPPHELAPGEFRDTVAAFTSATGATSETVTVERDTLPDSTLIGTIKNVGTSRVSSVTDSKGNTWRLEFQRAGTTAPACCLVYCQHATPLVAGDTITVTYTVSNAHHAILINEYAKRGYTLLATTTQAASGTTATSQAITASGPAAAGQLAVSAIAVAVAGTQTFSIADAIPTDMNLRQRAPTGTAIADALIKSAVTPQLTWQWSAAQNAWMIIATYQLPSP